MTSEVIGEYFVVTEPNQLHFALTRVVLGNLSRDLVQKGL